MQTRFDKRQEKENFRQLQESVIPWLTEVLQYFDDAFWWFTVSRKGKYRPGQQLLVDPPYPFELHTTQPVGQICFRVPDAVPKSKEELKAAQETVHHVVSIALIATVGLTNCNRALKDLRDSYGLSGIQKNASWASRRSDNNE
jgi:hypothetical protein